MKHFLYVLMILTLVFPVLSFGQEKDSDTETRIQDLEKTLQNQARRIEELRNKLQQNREQKQEITASTQEETRAYTEQIVREYLQQSNVEEDAGLSVGYENGFYVRSSDGNFEMRLTGFVQFGLGIFENDSFDNNSIFANGAYITSDFYFYDQWHARIQVDFTGFRDDGFIDGVEQGGGGLFQNDDDFELRLRDAYVEYTGTPEFQVRVGQTHVPLTIEGQYGENEGLTIFVEPFIAGWAHGRDPGIMILGTFADTLDYKVSMHNGEGENNVNQTDDFLFAGQLRFYPGTKSKNPNTFIHLGMLRGRDNRDKVDGEFGSATIVTGWGRRLFGLFDQADLEESAAVQGWRTAIDLGAKVVIGGLRLEGEVMVSRWERDFGNVENGDVVIFDRLAQLEGIGFFVGASYLINLSGNPDDGSGLFPTFKFSYVDLDDTGTDNVVAFNDGQTIYTYTIGIGYAFNRHVKMNLNWVMVEAKNDDIADIGPKDEDGVAAFDDTEHGWFFQVTAQW